LTVDTATLPRGPSNIALSEWGRISATLPDRLDVDRLAMHVIRIDLTGPSWRQCIAKPHTAERAAARALATMDWLVDACTPSRRASWPNVTWPAISASTACGRSSRMR